LINPIHASCGSHNQEPGGFHDKTSEKGCFNLQIKVTTSKKHPLQKISYLFAMEIPSRENLKQSIDIQSAEKLERNAAAAPRGCFYCLFMHRSWRRVRTSERRAILLSIIIFPAKEPSSCAAHSLARSAKSVCD
jgi:hypothetical protein